MKPIDAENLVEVIHDVPESQVDESPQHAQKFSAEDKGILRDFGRVGSPHLRLVKNDTPEPQVPILRPWTSRPAIDIPPRPWLHAGHFIRKLATMTVAPGGYGKTALEILNAIEMALGVGLIGPPPVAGQLRVLFWCTEDGDDELDRRIAAVCQQYDLNPKDLEGHLFVGRHLSRRGRFATFDQKANRVVFNDSLIETTRRFIRTHEIDCAILDPLVAFHSIPESNNGGMEELVKDCFEQLAIETNSCFELSQHTRKPAGGMQGALSAEDSRGASSVVYACRSVRVLNRMTVSEAEMPGVPPEERRLYIRIDKDKANLGPPGKANWIRLLGAQLPNGDNVQVATPWEYPGAFDDVSVADMHWVRDEVRNGSYRESARSPEWLGLALADRLGLDADNAGDRKRINAILKTWVANGVLDIESRKDESRKERKFYVPGNWKEPSIEGAPTSN